MRFLTTKDPTERNLIVAVGNEAAKLRKNLDHSLAVDIANCVGQLFKK